jgi:uncharacterized membrane protein YkoI
MPAPTLALRAGGGVFAGVSMRAGRRHTLGAVALLLGAALGAAVAARATGAAAPGALAAPDDPPQARSFAGGDGASRDRIIDAVQKRYHARVLRVSETSVNGRPALELRLLSEQRVFNIVVDAASGQVLSGG